MQVNQTAGTKYTPMVNSGVNGELIESSMNGEIVVTYDKSTGKMNVEFVETKTILPV